MVSQVVKRITRIPARMLMLKLVLYLKSQECLRLFLQDEKLPQHKAKFRHEMKYLERNLIVKWLL